MDSSNVILRWTIGAQDTVSLSDYELDKFRDMLWLCKLSIVSFQRWFPNARFVLLYNGNEFEHFIKMIESIDLSYLGEIEYIDQREALAKRKFDNPYQHFFPGGVWWKWVPFRLDISKHEIAVDTDIICISKPDTWYKWLESTEEILVAPERYEKVRVNTTGDFHAHPLLRDKAPFNCGIVGQRAGSNYEDRFFDITQEIKFGHTHDSLFITEQGAINLWVRSLELEGVQHRCLDFQKNAWMRDFIYFLAKHVVVETVHAVAWHKQIVKEFGECFIKRVYNDDYSDELFVADMIKKSTQFKQFSKTLISKQIGNGDNLNTEWLIPKESF